MVNLSVFDHLGPILGPSGPFWTISDKNDFSAPNGQSRGRQRCFGAKYQFLFEDGTLLLCFSSANCQWVSAPLKEHILLQTIMNWRSRSFKSFCPQRKFFSSTWFYLSDGHLMPVTFCFSWPSMSLFKLIKVGYILVFVAVQDSSI